MKPNPSLTFGELQKNTDKKIRCCSRVRHDPSAYKISIFQYLLKFKDEKEFLMTFYVRRKLGKNLTEGRFRQNLYLFLMLLVGKRLSISKTL
jgi:hypothetical protein